MDKLKKSEYNKAYRLKQKEIKRLALKHEKYDIKPESDTFNHDNSLKSMKSVTFNDNNTDNLLKSDESSDISSEDSDISNFNNDKAIQEYISNELSKRSKCQKNLQSPQKKSMIQDTLQHSINSIIGGLIMSLPVLIQYMTKPKARVIQTSSNPIETQQLENPLNQLFNQSSLDTNS